MNKKVSSILNFTILLAVVLFIDSAYCGISDAQIKAASKTFAGTMQDWMPAIIGGGLMGSGICLFANNFKMGIAGLAGTGFLYAAKSFVGDGQAALIDAAVQLLGMIS